MRNRHYTKKTAAVNLTWAVLVLTMVGLGGVPGPKLLYGFDVAQGLNVFAPEFKRSLNLSAGRVYVLALIPSGAAHFRLHVFAD